MTTLLTPGNNEQWQIDPTKTSILSDEYEDVNIPTVMAITVRDPDGWYEAHVKYDGCVEVTRYANRPYDSNHPDRNEEDYYGFIHICDIDDFIARLTSLKAAAESYFAIHRPDGGWGYLDDQGKIQHD